MRRTQVRLRLERVTNSPAGWSDLPRSKPNNESAKEGADGMVTGYILVEGMRVGACLEGLPLRLLKIDRYRMPTATPQQPPVWTTVEFEFEERHAERVAAALSEVVSEEGGWYTNFTHDEETFVIFADRIFRYRPGDRAARAEAAAYGSSMGVPDTQLDWEE